MKLKMKKKLTVWVLSSLLVVLSGVITSPVFAQAGACARVKLEIEQELTLERSAFDARMTINNGLEGIDLEQVMVDVIIADSSGNDASSLFFIDIFEMSGINDVSGNGIVVGSTSAEIHWLIVPAIGAGGAMPEGVAYQVGAVLTYRLKGENQVTEVLPDSIVVRPQPSLLLDYFYPQFVLGDDPFTPQEEPSISYTLGVRVQNSGFGPAANVSINSAQPVITENSQGLFVDFRILDSYLNDQPVQNSLLLQFGDLVPGQAVMGRWNSISSLMGEFISFETEFTHSDALGGELTSLIEDVRPHYLIHDVLLDLPDRDMIRDFLALDGDIVRVYGSDGVDEEAASYQPGDPLVNVGSAPSIAVPEVVVGVPGAVGPLYVKIVAPANGDVPLKAVIRSDGKALFEENYWISRERDGNKNWHSFLNIFDYNSTGDFTITYDFGGENGVLVVSPTEVSFGVLLAGQTTDLPVIVSNSGVGSITVSAIELTAGSSIDFGVIFNRQLPLIIAPGEQLALQVSFTAREQGVRNATLRVVTPGQAVDVSLTAIGDTDKDGDGIGDISDLCDNRLEPNDDFTSAYRVTVFPAQLGDTCIDTVDDLDFYSFTAAANDIVNARLNDAQPTLSAAIGLFNQCGSLIHISRSAVDGIPEIRGAVIPASGEYYLAVVSAPDYTFNGSGQSEGWYRLELNVTLNLGDFDLDGDCDSADLGVFKQCYGTYAGDLGFDAMCDYYADGYIGPEDLDLFGTFFGLSSLGVRFAIDVDGDSDIDGIDVLVCATAFGSKIGDPTYMQVCDVNNDSAVDELDLAVLTANFGGEVCR